MASLVESTHPTNGEQKSSATTTLPIITIFTLTSCKHCQRAKTLLKNKEWLYNEIDLSIYPQAKENMLKACSRLSVPQIFFGDKWIGGADELYTLERKETLSEIYTNSRNYNDEKVRKFLVAPDKSTAVLFDNPAPALNEPDVVICGIRQTYSEVFATLTGPTLVTSSRRRRQHQNNTKNEMKGHSNETKSGSNETKNYKHASDKSSKQDSKNSTPPESSESSDDGEKEGSRNDRMNEKGLITESTGSSSKPTSDVNVPMLEIKDRSYSILTYRQCFLGSDLVTVIADRYSVDRRKAIEIGRMLFQLNMFSHVANDHIFLDEKYFYRFTAHEEPLVLNSWRVWNDRVDPEPVNLVRRLKKQLDKIISKHRRTSDGLVAYDDAYDDKDFRLFDEATCELQKININRLTNEEKLAFHLNTYNLLVKHAFAKLGRPESIIKRDFFFSNISYNIAGDVYSLNDIENGILRGNKKPAGFHIYRSFSSGDPRLDNIIEHPDPRIHFALNCGAKSCPPVKEYTKEAVLEELRVVAIAFCMSEENVDVDVEKCELRISKLFHWYLYDFAKTEKMLLSEMIPKWLVGEKLEKWMMVVNSGKYKLKKNKYDWTTDAVPTGKVFQGRPRGR
jgi:glutaredoxin